MLNKYFNMAKEGKAEVVEFGQKDEMISWLKRTSFDNMFPVAPQ